jgi:hypothetical protein
MQPQRELRLLLRSMFPSGKLYLTTANLFRQSWTSFTLKVPQSDGSCRKRKVLQTNTKKAKRKGLTLSAFWISVWHGSHRLKKREDKRVRAPVRKYKAQTKETALNDDLHLGSLNSLLEQMDEGKAELPNLFYRCYT